jgi:hypothetical protein
MLLAKTFIGCLWLLWRSCWGTRQPTGSTAAIPLQIAVVQPVIGDGGAKSVAI